MRDFYLWVAVWVAYLGLLDVWEALRVRRRIAAINVPIMARVKVTSFVKVNRSKWWHYPNDDALTLCGYVHQGPVVNVLMHSKPVCPRCMTIQKRRNSEKQG